MQTATNRSIPYYSGIGYMYRIPRYDSKNIHVASETRKEWLQELNSQHKHFSVYSVCGELSSVEFIENIFDNPEYSERCDSYEVIFGPEIDTSEIRSKLKSLMEINPKLKVYSYPSRPEDHGIKIEDRLLCEEQHKEGVGYQFATIVEKAEKNIQDRFMSNFFNLKASSTQKTKDDIENVPIRRKL